MIGPIDKFDAQGLAAGRAEALGAGGAAPAEKRKAAEEFVSLLFLEVLKAMRAAVPKGGLFESDSMENDIYTSMADTEVARAIAGREALGLRQMIEKALDRAAAKPVERRQVDAFDYRPAQAPVSRLYQSVERDRAPESPARELEAPAKGAVSSKFGLRADPWTGARRFHSGVDIAAPAGSPVRAAAAGKVAFSGWAEGYGNLVTGDHGDGTVTRYGHNGANLVAAGDEVAARHESALVGATGRATGPHLHFEVERHGQAVDPMQIIDYQGLFSESKKG